jgi:hypothetical protein
MVIDDFWVQQDLPLKFQAQPFDAVRTRFQRSVHQDGRGMYCPCCGQYAKLYRRKLNSGMAKALIALAEEGADWVDVTGLGRAAQQLLHHLEYTKLRFWGLIEKHPTAKTSVWRVTERGREVLQGARLPRYVFVYDNRVQSVSESTTTLHTALGDHFDYSGLSCTKPKQPELEFENYELF